jgi:hypothetical protein
MTQIQSLFNHWKFEYGFFLVGAASSRDLGFRVTSFRDWKPLPRENEQVNGIGPVPKSP